jgi:hypothetical protein
LSFSLLKSFEKGIWAFCSLLTIPELEGLGSCIPLLSRQRQRKRGAEGLALFCSEAEKEEGSQRVLALSCSEAEEKEGCGGFVALCCPEAEEEGCRAFQSSPVQRQRRRRDAGGLIPHLSRGKGGGVHTGFVALSCPEAEEEGCRGF